MFISLFNEIFTIDCVSCQPKKQRSWEGGDVHTILFHHLHLLKWSFRSIWQNPATIHSASLRSTQFLSTAPHFNVGTNVWWKFNCLIRSPLGTAWTLVSPWIMFYYNWFNYTHLANGRDEWWSKPWASIRQAHPSTYASSSRQKKTPPCVGLRKPVFKCCKYWWFFGRNFECLLRIDTPARQFRWVLRSRYGEVCWFYFGTCTDSEIAFAQSARTINLIYFFARFS